MQCSDVGAEAWLFVAVTTALVVLFVVRSRETQRWLRDGHRGRGAFFWYPVLLEERNLWRFRLLHAPILLLMWVVSFGALYCFFHGTDLPPR
jgi:hypothetical protein